MFNWRRYNEKLLKRGEILLNLDFIKRFDEELKEMNKGKFKRGNINGKILIVDSTGFQMGRTKEYEEYRHKLRRRKKWIKLHIIKDGKK